jgi:uroporphyrin-III C-methyltransferase
MIRTIAGGSGKPRHERSRRAARRLNRMTDRNLLADVFARMPVLEPGHVWLAGAGPGDPALLTLQALAGLAQASVVVHDALVDKRVLALIGPNTRLEYAGKRGGKPSAIQADISKRLIELARAGERVLRLKGGDPFVFGRGGEEAIALASASVPYRVIPGVTSGLAALAAASIPATMRGVNRAVIFAAGYGAEEPDVDWAALARTGEPIVLYMPMHHLDVIAGALMRGGVAPATPAAVIVSATSQDERVLISTLEHIAADTRAGGYAPPAIVVIGDIVAMRDRLRGGTINEITP